MRFGLRLFLLRIIIRQRGYFRVKGQGARSKRIERVFSVDVVISIEKCADFGSSEVVVVLGEPAFIKAACPGDVEFDTFGILEGHLAGTNPHNHVVTAGESIV